MRTLIVSGVLAALAVLAAPAKAAEVVADPSTQREFIAKMGMCGLCHGGENGVPRSPNIPVILGQQENYLLKQLQDFQSGDRANELMIWAAKTLSPAELAPAAAHFAKRNWPARSAAAASTPPPGGLAVCQACHQQNFAGTLRVEGQTAPRLAGQSYEYLVEAMRGFAEGERTNDATMVELMKATPPAQRQAMARYISGL